MDEWYDLPLEQRPSRYQTTITFTPNPDRPWFLQQGNDCYRIDSLSLPTEISAQGQSFEMKPMRYSDKRVMYGTVEMPEDAPIKAVEIALLGMEPASKEVPRKFSRLASTQPTGLSLLRTKQVPALLRKLQPSGAALWDTHRIVDARLRGHVLASASGQTAQNYFERRQPSNR